MKKIIKILLVIIILFIVSVGITTLMQHDSQHQSQNESQQDIQILDENSTVIGHNSNGTVYRIVCGNNSSDDAAIVILGVHSLEGGIHNATYDVIMNLTKENKLNKKFIVYFIKIDYNASGLNTSDYDTNRHMGEMLANKYVVPDIEKYDSYIVIDVHEMESYWDKLRYVGVINNKSSVTMEYAHLISDNLSYPIYTINAGTSPKWVTVPIAKKNHDVILFETAQNDTQHNKTQTAVNLVRTIDRLPVHK